MANGSYSLDAVCGLLIAVALVAEASLVAAEHGLWGARASLVAARGLHSTGLAVGQQLNCLQHVGSSRISGTEPMSPALAGRFFTTEPFGKPNKTFLKQIHLLTSSYCANLLHQPSEFLQEDRNLYQFGLSFKSTVLSL